MIIETERLILREYTPEDFDAIFEILSDSETMQHYPKPYDEAMTRRWIEWNMENYKEHGFGLWAVVLKETGEFIGDCGMSIQNIDGELLPEIGYHIHKKHWRKGYGSEAARAVRDWAFTETDYDCLYSYMKYTNVGSYSTAVANGMKRVKEYPDEKNKISYAYAITREEWKKKRCNFGMPTLIENKTLEDNIALCSELGLSFIELNMNFPEYQIDKLEDTERFIEPADRAGIYYTIHLDENLNIADFNPLVRGAYLETVRRTIEVAKKLTALKDKYGNKQQPLTINMHMHHGIYITLPDKKVQMYERDFDVYMEAFRSFRKLCEQWIGDSRIRIAVENTDGFREYEKRAVEYLLQSPCFVLTWDIGHSKATKEADVPFILSHEDKLKHFHIHDGSENPPKNHLALGDGEIDLNDRLKKAEECNARCVLETKTIAALRKSAEWLKNR